MFHNREGNESLSRHYLWCREHTVSPLWTASCVSACPFQRRGYGHWACTCSLSVSALYLWQWGNIQPMHTLCLKSDNTSVTCRCTLTVVQIFGYFIFSCLVLILMLVWPGSVLVCYMVSKPENQQYKGTLCMNACTWNKVTNYCKSTKLFVLKLQVTA